MEGMDGVFFVVIGHRLEYNQSRVFIINTYRRSAI